MKKLSILVMAVAVMGALAAQAQIPATMSYQGVLTDGGGTPVADGNYDITFKLYDSASGGSALWTETQSVAVTGGIFSAVLGIVTPLDLPFDRPYWLGVSVGGAAELSPRRALTSSPYSLGANDVADSAITGGKISTGTVVRSLNGLRDDVTIEGGSNIDVSVSADTILIDATGVGTGDITGVVAGDGLQGGGVAGDVTLDVGGGTGVSVTPTSIDLDTVYADGRFVNAGEAGAVDTGMLQDSAVTEAKLGTASVTGEKIASGAVVKSLSGLRDDVTLAAGANVTITSSNDSLIIASSGGATGDNTLDQAYDQGGAGAGRVITADAGAVHVSGNDGLIVDGMVGVGTNSPSEMLDVLGGIGCTGFKLSTDPQSGYVLTSDDFGVASWQPVATNSWSLLGNSGTNPNSNFVGTQDSVALEIRVNNRQVMRFEPRGTSPNVVAGHENNSVWQFVYGATIGGGGEAGANNSVSDVFGTVGGGSNNRAGDASGGFNDAEHATVGGGEGNQARKAYSTIAGGRSNTVLDIYGTIGGGQNNTAGNDHATVGGGINNNANGANATVGGGTGNTAGQRATVGGGENNDANVSEATISGGTGNTASGIGATISGGENNQATGTQAFIGGGLDNTAGLFAAVTAGVENVATGNYGAIGGGYSNSVTGLYGTVAGGGRINLLDPATGNRVTNDYGSVGGGGDNEASGLYGTVGGGKSNTAGGGSSTVGGGDGNAASGSSATVSGGQNNAADGSNSAIGGGTNNQSSGSNVTISGGYSNTTSADYAAIGGGFANDVQERWSTVSGGIGNTVTAEMGTIGGGGRSPFTDETTGNRVTDDYGTVGGGSDNQAGDAAGTKDDAEYATVAGGQHNEAAARHATVGGGTTNIANAQGATVGGGSSNDATGGSSTVGGGSANEASGSGAVVAGGSVNVASASNATVSGGTQNQATEFYATVAGGWQNIARGARSVISGGTNNTTDGEYAVVAGGSLNSAAGDFSFAAGRQASVNASHNGTFLWADSIPRVFSSAASNEFAVRSTGGVRLVTAVDLGGNPTAGAVLAPGGSSWGTVSDRNAKQNFSPADGEDVLEKLAAIEISTWNYKTQDPSIRHMGPMAQDFYAAFGLGADEKRINTVDADGVALAAIQGLDQKLRRELEDKDRQIKRLEGRLAELERLVEATLSAADANEVAAGTKEAGQ